MPQSPQSLITIALELGAPPAVRTHRRVLGYLVPRFGEVPDALFGDLLLGLSELPGSLMVAAAEDSPGAFGSLAARTIRASGLRRSLALGRLCAGLPVGPEDATQNIGLVLPPALRQRLQIDVALAQDVLCVSENGGLYGIVAARHLDEYRSIYEVARRMPDAEAAQVVADIETALFGAPLDSSGSASSDDLS